MISRLTKTSITPDRRRFLKVAIGSVWSGFLARTVHGQQVIDREHPIKAAFIYRVINYVEWPDGTFPTPKSPLIIGGAGDDPVNKYLGIIATKRFVGQRPLEFRHIKTANQAAECHIIFVSTTTPGPLRDAMIKLARPILLVGESAKFTASGGIINLAVRDNKVQLELSRRNAQKRGLQISSNLARVATIVD